MVPSIVLCLILFPTLILSYPSNLPVIAYQKLTGKVLPPCSIKINESVDGRFSRLDRHRRFRISFSDFLYADQCAVQSRQDIFQNIDLNFDGSIDRKEWDVWSRKIDADKRKEKLKENHQLFEYFDKDHNSWLDAQELRKYVRFRRCNPTNIKSYLRDKKALDFHSFDAFTYIIPNEIFPLGRRNRTIPKKPDYGEGNCQKPETHSDEFLRLDVNRNRKISFDEFLRFERCAILRHRRKFRSMDANGDHYLSLYEFRNFYSHRDKLWEKVYNMRMNSVVHDYDQNGDMLLDRTEIKAFLADQDIDDKNIDYFLRGRKLDPKQFADWEETLPNSMFPLSEVAVIQKPPKKKEWSQDKNGMFG